jgi:DNA replication protein DnaC
MQAFAADPAGANVFLFGPTGLGKTRLMLASHFALLRRGVNSRYVTSPELRSLFRRKESFDEDAAKEANDALLALQGAAVIHADDLGDIEGDERKKGGFAEGLKDLLRLARGTWVFSTNCGYAELKSHPDIGAKNLSRMVEGATLVPMEGKDFRVQTAKVAK